MLIPENRGMRFAIPAEKSGGIVVFFTGSFDILRYVTPLIGIEHRNDDGDTAIKAEDADENFFIFVKPFETGDRMNRMDSIKSSIKNFPFVKTIEQYVSGDQRKKSNPEERIISIESTLPLERKNDLKRADTIHILFILLNFTVIFVHWNNVWMSGFLLATIGIVALLKKSVKIQENRIVWYRNSSLIFLFLTMLVFTKIEGNMGLPGSIFLTQILIIKKLFPDNREDGFLYIFLSLFVFVAVAITSTALWFILFFLVYLILAILLLSTVSGYGFNEPINSSVGTRVRTFSYFRSLFAILIMMAGLFFIIPHGEAIERNSTFTTQKPTETRSGFGNEINLQNVAGIKKDLSKKIVVGNLNANQAEFLKTYYWRGDRYTEFHGNKWEKPGFIAQKNIVISPTGIANIHGGKWNRENQNYDAGSGMTLTESEILDTYRVTYYTTGTKNLFFPKTPENFNFIDRSIHTNLYVTQNDNSLYSISPSPNEPIILDISIKRSKNTNQLIDAHSTFVPFQIRIDSETEALFQTFWDSIDPKLRNSPS